MSALREKILAAETRPFEKVTVQAWDCEVVVRGMGGAQRDAFESACRKVVGKEISVNTDNLRARILVQCLYESETPGSPRMFSDADADKLGEQGAAVLEPLVEAAQRLSGMTAKDVKELAENFPPAPTAASPSA